MGFDDLPMDLKNVVSEFAYDCTWKTVEKNLETCETLDLAQKLKTAAQTAEHDHGQIEAGRQFLVGVVTRPM